MAPASAPLRVLQIRDREELIQVLGIASELEHNLMCQYLFAAYSLKRYPWEGLTSVQLDTARSWGALITACGSPGDGAPRPGNEPALGGRSAAVFQAAEFPAKAGLLRQSRYQ